MGRIAKHNSKFLIVGISCCIVVGALLFFHPASATPYTVADNIGGSTGLTTSDLKTVVINVIKWILGILALVAVVLIIYGGIIWMTAAGNAEKIEKAKRIIIDAVIGLVIVLISWAIVTFVIAKILGVSGGGSVPPFRCTPGSVDPRCRGAGSIGLEIRSITTDCKPAPDAGGSYQEGVFICSAINITFNHVLKGASVQDAVNGADPKLIIEQCSDDTCSAGPVAIADGSALDGHPGAADNSQLFVNSSGAAFTNDLKAGAAWAARLDNTGKNITFFHVPALYEKNTYYRVTIPKSIKDLNDDGITGCRSSNNAMADLDGCDDHVGPPGYYTWMMETGTDVDTLQPVVSSSYPSTAYLGTGSTAQPDQSVPRTPLINVHYNKAVLPPTSVEIIPYDMSDPTTIPPPDPVTGTGGTLLPPLDPTTYTVTPGDDGKSFIVKLNGGVLLNKFTWYKVRVNGVIDLCSNLQKPEPFEWVFETNDVVPGIAGEYPKSGYANSCPSTPA